MEQPTVFVNLTKRYSADKACKQALARLRWRDGFICPKCGHDGQINSNTALCASATATVITGLNSPVVPF